VVATPLGRRFLVVAAFRVDVRSSVFLVGAFVFTAAPQAPR
jgi:hypothetical protein